jgi:type 1 glutamine amidotransferase
MQVILKNRILNIFGLILIVNLIFSCTGKLTSKPRILLITGGHDFDTTEFFNLIESLSEFTIDTMSQPKANHFIASGGALKYDALIFYDMWQSINDEEKKAYINLTDHGKGFLFLHHSLVSYQEWDEFSVMRGGKYVIANPPDSLIDSNYRHDIDLYINIQDTSNRITPGMKDFIIHDEGYSNIIVNDDVVPLLKTSHKDCSELVAWTKKYHNSEIVYLMGGHDRLAYKNENYKNLIRNSLNYLTEKK